MSRSLSDWELKSSIISHGFFMNLPHCTGSEQLKGKQAEIPALEDLRNVRIWFLLLVLNLFCQGVEPFEVKGDTNEIPLAFNCVQPA